MTTQKQLYVAKTVPRQYVMRLLWLGLVIGIGAWCSQATAQILVNAPIPFVVNQASVGYTAKGGLAEASLTSKVYLEVFEPNITAIKTARLLLDADQNGRASAGDTLEFTITASNRTNVPARKVVISDPFDDPYLTLKPGSVTTTQGVITTGNQATDTSIRVDVGDIDDYSDVVVMAQAMISLSITTDNVSNQGLITGGNFPDTPTDDPNDSTTVQNHAGDPGDRTVIVTETPSCDLDLTPQGSVTVPAYTERVLSDGVYYFPFTVKNVGNAFNAFQIESSLLEEESDLAMMEEALAEVQVYLDENQDGAPDTLEVVQRVDINQFETKSLLLKVGMPTLKDSASGTVYADVRATCLPRDSTFGLRQLNLISKNSVVRLSLELGGLGELSKTLIHDCEGQTSACEDQAVYPGANVAFEISLDTKQRPLFNVRIIDALDINIETDSTTLRFDNTANRNDFIRLENPAGENILPELLLSGEITYTATYTPYTAQEAALDPNRSGRIEWTFNTLPADTTLTVRVESTVVDQAKLKGTSGSVSISNQAQVYFDGQEKNPDGSLLPEHTASSDTKPVAEVLGLRLSKTIRSRVIRPGESLHYILEATNPSYEEASRGPGLTVAPLRNLVLYDPLPLGLHYIPNTSVMTLSNGTAIDCTQESQPCEPRLEPLASFVERPINYLGDPNSRAYQTLSSVLPILAEAQAQGFLLTLEEVEASLSSLSGEVLVWDSPDLSPGESVHVEFDAQVLPEALFSERVINRAMAKSYNRQQNAIAVATDFVPAEPDIEMFNVGSVVMGRAYVDNDRNGLPGDGDTPIPNMRLYLSNGLSTITDEAGRYTFLELPSGLEALKVDLTTVPPHAMHVTANEALPGLWRLRLQPGLITRQDIPFEPIEARVAADEQLLVERGPIKVLREIRVVGNDANVVLTITSSEALPGATVSEYLQPEVAITYMPTDVNSGTSLTSDVNSNIVTLRLGDIPAGYSKKVSYRLRLPELRLDSTTGGVPRSLPLIAPVISWELR